MECYWCLKENSIVNWIKQGEDLILHEPQASSMNMIGGKMGSASVSVTLRINVLVFSVKDNHGESIPSLTIKSGIALAPCINL